MIDLKDDVAGATLMAAGSSAPELATTIIALFIAKVFLRDFRHKQAAINLIILQFKFTRMLILDLEQ